MLQTRFSRIQRSALSGLRLQDFLGTCYSMQRATDNNNPSTVSLLSSEFDEVMRSYDRAVQPLGMLLKHAEAFWVGLLGNNYRAFGLHDACLSFCNSFNTSACTKSCKTVK
ncbi:MAG: hypothetical protein FRX49_07019 [Trebouxia sp. A1-2]|nr:MAG: hypothetical protein FRX49_07019 [Trebouxia sp. A1-2]